MVPVLAPAPPKTSPVQAADNRSRGCDALAQALCEHHDRPDAGHAAQVLRCLDPASVAEGFDLPALQARLGPADALVLQGRQGEELLACVVRADGVQVFRRLARWHEVQAAWRLARFQLDALSQGAGPPPADRPKLFKRAQARLQALHGLVWAPLADALTDARRVLLVPTAGLAGLPFAALQDGLTCLAQRHLLAEAPSLGLALRGLSPPAGPADAAPTRHADPASAGAHDPEVLLLGLGDAKGPCGSDLARQVQALLAAGRSRVLVRRWPVDKVVTAAFIDRFQLERQRGRGPAEALSEAQAGLMVQHPHPAFWAGFVLCGGW